MILTKTKCMVASSAANALLRTSCSDFDRIRIHAIKMLPKVRSQDLVEAGAFMVTSARKKYI